jgi:hypothetical protein
MNMQQLAAIRKRNPNGETERVMTWWGWRETRAYLATFPLSGWSYTSSHRCRSQTRQGLQKSSSRDWEHLQLRRHDDTMKLARTDRARTRWVNNGTSREEMVATNLRLREKICCKQLGKNEQTDEPSPCK